MSSSTRRAPAPPPWTTCWARPPPDRARRRAALAGHRAAPTSGFVEAASQGLTVEVAEGDFGERGGATAARELLDRRPTSPRSTRARSARPSACTTPRSSARRPGGAPARRLRRHAARRVPSPAADDGEDAAGRAGAAGRRRSRRAAARRRAQGRRRGRRARGRRQVLDGRAAMSVIVDVEAIALRAPCDPDDLDSSSETIVVRLTDEEGRTGIGEADAPALAVRELVLMEDATPGAGAPRAPPRTGPVRARGPLARPRRGHDLPRPPGLGVHALSAVDVAVHDLAGKQLGRPVYQLLGGARQERIRPYATPGRARWGDGARPDDGRDRALASVPSPRGFGREDGGLLRRPRHRPRARRCIREGRRLVGDVAFMVDFGYRWSDWRDALPVLVAIEECDVLPRRARHDDPPATRTPPLLDPNRRGGDGRDRRRVPRMAGAWTGRRPAAGRQPVRRSHRAAPDRGAGRLGRRDRRAAPLEDRDQRRCGRALPGRDPNVPTWSCSRRSSSTRRSVPS